LALEKQKELNEKLEIDLLSINKENGCRPSGDSEQDVLSALDIGKKPVSTGNKYLGHKLSILTLFIGYTRPCDSDTIHTIRRHLHSSYRNKPTGPL
jgi:calcineurin-like phosphoesterase